MQSAVMDSVYRSDESLIVTAPTGAGKTVVFELAMARLFLTFPSGSPRPDGSAKVIYIAPMKALCQERHQDWSERFAPLGLRVAELTGDSNELERAAARNADVLVTTPEKWDSTTRMWRSHHSLVGQIGLLLVDEVHLLGDDRGAALEAVVTRMLTLSRSPAVIGTPMGALRVVAVSATAPNADDIATWLGARMCRFGPEYRPCPLTTHVIPLDDSGRNPFLFGKLLDGQLPGVIRAYSDGKPTLVFCATRAATEQAAAAVAQSGVSVNTLSSQGHQALRTAATGIENAKLKSLILSGVAFHSAGLSPRDRRAVEQLFRAGALSVVCTTSTLAMGVNLPARLVVVRGIDQYRAASTWAPYSPFSVLQMVGRAGRPQFDTVGVAVIMCTRAQAPAMQAVGEGSHAIESQLLAKLGSHLAAEIDNGTVACLADADRWVQSTFLATRMRRDPGRYSASSALSADSIDDTLRTSVRGTVEVLKSSGLVQLGVRGPGTLVTTPAGHTMTKLYLSLATAQAFMSLSLASGPAAVLRAVAEADEFSDVSARNTERKDLNSINKHPDMVFPLRTSVKSGPLKVACLIKAALIGLPISSRALNAEAASLVQQASRLTRGLAEMLRFRGGGRAAAHAARLATALSAGTFATGANVFRQAKGVGDAATAALAAAGIDSIPAALSAGADAVATVCGRKAPFGETVLAAVTATPRPAVEVGADGRLILRSLPWTPTGLAGPAVTRPRGFQDQWTVAAYHSKTLAPLLGVALLGEDLDGYVVQLDPELVRGGLAVVEVIHSAVAGTEARFGAPDVAAITEADDDGTVGKQKLKAAAKAESLDRGAGVVIAESLPAPSAAIRRSSGASTGAGALVPSARDSDSSGLASLRAHRAAAAGANPDIAEFAHTHRSDQLASSVLPDALTPVPTTTSAAARETCSFEADYLPLARHAPSGPQFVAPKAAADPIRLPLSAGSSGSAGSAGPPQHAACAPLHPAGPSLAPAPSVDAAPTAPRTQRPISHFLASAPSVHAVPAAPVVSQKPSGPVQSRIEMSAWERQAKRLNASSHAASPADAKPHAEPQFGRDDSPFAPSEPLSAAEEARLSAMGYFRRRPCAEAQTQTGPPSPLPPDYTGLAAPTPASLAQWGHTPPSVVEVAGVTPQRCDFASFPDAGHSTEPTTTPLISGVHARFRQFDLARRPNFPFLDSQAPPSQSVPARALGVDLAAQTAPFPRQRHNLATRPAGLRAGQSPMPQLRYALPSPLPSPNRTAAEVRAETRPGGHGLPTPPRAGDKRPVFTSLAADADDVERFLARAARASSAPDASRGFRIW
jgi:replicative superfamily II helicase